MARMSNIYMVPPEEGSYGDLIRRERIKRGWSQEDLADRVSAILYPDGDKELRQGMISGYEVGKTKRPHPEIAAAIDEAFGWERGTVIDAAGYGKGGKSRVERSALPGDIVVRNPLPTLRRIWEHLDAIGDEQELLLVERDILHRRTQGSAADTVRDDEPEVREDTEPGTKETAG